MERQQPNNEPQRDHDEMRMYGFDPNSESDCAEWDAITERLTYKPGDETDYSMDIYEYGAPPRQTE